MTKQNKYKSSTSHLLSVKELLLGVYVGRVMGVHSRRAAKPKSLGWFARIPVVLLIGVVLIVAAVFFVPQLYYRVVPADVVVLEPVEQGSVRGGAFAPPSKDGLGRQYQPQVEEGLPDGDWIIIPQIGVRTEFRATQDPNEALTQGAWLAPEYARPGESGLPMIIAAHRFGWDWWWQSDYWRYHSFYRLPETEPGTLVEVISNKKKWVYEIYGGEEGDSISDYDADLILYTCKHLSSPIRYVRYARLIDPNAVVQTNTSPAEDNQEIQLSPTRLSDDI